MILSNTSSMLDSGFGGAAEKYVEQSEEVFTWLSEMDGDARKIISASMYKNGLRTKEGIDKVISEAKALGKDTTDLEELRDTIVSNLGIEIKTAQEAFLTSWKNDSKGVKKLTSGIDLNTAQEMIDEASHF